MRTEVICQVESGVISNRVALKRAFEAYSGRIRVTIEPYRSKRSDPQNRYFHGVVIPLVSNRLVDLGFNEAKSLDWTKDFIKMNCLLKESVNEQTGEIYKHLGATSGLTKSEFMDFVADIQMWAAEKLDLFIPDPL